MEEFVTEPVEIKPEKKSKKTNKVVSFKNVDTSNPIVYKSKSELISQNFKSLIYPVFKNSKMLYFVVDKDIVKVCTVK